MSAMSDTRREVAAAEAEAKRVAAITNTCVGAGRPALIAKFVGDPTISVDQVAAELAKLAGLAGKADGNSLAGLDFDAIIAQHQKLATAARVPGR